MLLSYGLDDILTKSINGSGYNSEYGLGTNFTMKKLNFPSDNQQLLLKYKTKFIIKLKIS